MTTDRQLPGGASEPSKLNRFWRRTANLTHGIAVVAIAATVCLMSSLLYSKQPAESSSWDKVKSADELASLLDKRWTVSNIEAFCIPETRHCPAEANLSPGSGEMWHGFLHTSAESRIGKVYWYAPIEDGRVSRISLNVVKNNDHWHLETVSRASDLFRPLDTRQVIQRRVVVAIINSISTYPCTDRAQKRGWDKDWDIRYSLFRGDFVRDTRELFEYGPDNDQHPIGYTRRARLDRQQEPLHEFVATLGNDSTPKEFLLDGKKDEYMDRVYSAYVRDYPGWVGTLIYGYEGASANSAMLWDEHLEALGLSEDNIRFMVKQPLHAGVMPLTRERRYPSLDAVTQPDYRSWRKVARGMTEAEVFRILGPPQKKDIRQFGWYIWYYGTVVPNSQVIPEGYEFRIWFSAGRVGSKKDPFGGHFSRDGLPTPPEPIFPQDQATFSHYPAFIDLRWSPSSGKYPIQYEIDLSYASTMATAAEPYLSTRIPSGVKTARWRVRGVNARGKSDWSEWRRFEWKQADGNLGRD
jgi:hypothetical protein